MLQLSSEVSSRIQQLEFQPEVELVLIFKKQVIEFAGKFVILKARGEEHVISRKFAQAA